MTLDEARRAIGRRVSYTAPHRGARPEVGVITSVGHLYAFVLYDTDVSPKATPTELLTLKGGPS